MRESVTSLEQANGSLLEEKTAIEQIATRSQADLTDLRQKVDYLEAKLSQAESERDSVVNQLEAELDQIQGLKSERD